MSLLFDLLHTQESLWNKKHETYKDHNFKKREYHEMRKGLWEEAPGLAFPDLKGKFFVDRTFGPWC